MVLRKILSRLWLRKLVELRCNYCGERLVWRQSTRIGDTASLDRIYNDCKINELNCEWVSDDCNWSKSAKMPEAFIRHSFSIVFQITESKDRLR